MCICQMIRYNLTICSYCFIVYTFDDINISLLVSSCTLHSRKFPTSHRYTPITSGFVDQIQVFHLNSFSFPRFYLFATWFSWSLTITQLQPSRFYPIVSRTITTCTGFFPVISVVLSHQLILWILSTFESNYSHILSFSVT